MSNLLNNLLGDAANKLNTEAEIKKQAELDEANRKKAAQEKAEKQIKLLDKLTNQIASIKEVAANQKTEPAAKNLYPKKINKETESTDEFVDGLNNQINLAKGEVKTKKSEIIQKRKQLYTTIVNHLESNVEGFDIKSASSQNQIQSILNNPELEDNQEIQNISKEINLIRDEISEKEMEIENKKLELDNFISNSDFEANQKQTQLEDRLEAGLQNFQKKESDFRTELENSEAGQEILKQQKSTEESSLIDSKIDELLAPYENSFVTFESGDYNLLGIRKDYIEYFLSQNGSIVYDKLKERVFSVIENNLIEKLAKKSTRPNEILNKPSDMITDQPEDVTPPTYYSLERIAEYNITQKLEMNPDNIYDKYPSYESNFLAELTEQLINSYHKYPDNNNGKIIDFETEGQINELKNKWVNGIEKILNKQIYSEKTQELQQATRELQTFKFNNSNKLVQSQNSLTLKNRYSEANPEPVINQLITMLNENELTKTVEIQPDNYYNSFNFIFPELNSLNNKMREAVINRANEIISETKTETSPGIEELTDSTKYNNLIDEIDGDIVNLQNQLAETGRTKFGIRKELSKKIESKNKILVILEKYKEQQLADILERDSSQELLYNTGQEAGKLAISIKDIFDMFIGGDNKVATNTNVLDSSLRNFSKSILDYQEPKEILDLKEEKAELEESVNNLTKEIEQINL